MPNFFPLDIFPTGALSSSVITTVWVGVFVVVFLNLRLGTTLSGLVVPGYLVPLFILRPVSASVIIAEGLITYWLANLLAERLPKRLSYAEIFGRDRFFALILISVAVRLVFDGLLLPELGDYLAGQGFEYDYRNNLHSFGLIIVALIANQMWNGGLRQGSIALLLYVGLTYLIVRYVLMELTNFNISTLSYMYEDLASSILASPKAYIILLVSAFIASRMNLKYGWEFNGILIPSLLALQWYQPDKLIITLVESLIIYTVAAGLLRLSFFKKLHIEGPRQILLFFNISFAYKMALGFFLITFLPNQKVSDFYAFGYLLSTLLALKMYQKDIAIRIGRSIMQASLAGVIAASLIGFMLTLLPSGTAQDNVPQFSTEASVDRVEADLEEHINKLSVSLYSSQENTLSGQANPLEMDRLNQFFLDIKAYLLDKQDSRLNLLYNQGLAINLNMTWLNQRYLVIEDGQPERGWGIFLFDTANDSELAIEVPAPLDELQTIETAATLFHHLSAKSLALGGKKLKQSPDGTSDSLKNPQTAFQLFHRHFGAQNALQVRQYTRQSSRRLLGIGAEQTAQFLNLSQNQLWVKRTLPDDLNIKVLDSMIDNLDIQWRPAPLENRQQDTSPQGFAELFLSPEGIRSIFAFAATETTYAVQNRAQRIDGYLLNWINDNQELIATRGSNSYTPARLAEMLFLDQNVVTPIIRLLDGALAAGWDDNVKPKIQRINSLALALSYQLMLYHHQTSGDNFLILQEIPSPESRHWGTYVFRIGEAAPYVIEVPRPLAEINTLAFGANLFERLKARVLLIAGTHPYANADGTANLLHSANKISLFNLVHEAVQREARDSALMTLQLRAFSSNNRMESTGSDVMLARLGVEIGVYPLLTTPLEQVMADYGLTYEYAQGSLGTTGYDASWNAQARYAPFTRNKPFFVLWVSPETRKNYRDQEENRQQKLKFSSLGIYTSEVDIADWVSATSASGEHSVSINYSLLKEYFENENIIVLDRFARQYQALDFQRLVDINTGQAYLAIRQANGYLIALINLQTQNHKIEMFDSGMPPSKEQTQKFVDNRVRWLLRGEGR